MKHHTFAVRLIQFPFIAARSVFSGLVASTFWLLDDTYDHKASMFATFEWLKPKP